MFANNSAYQTNLNTLFHSLSSNATNNPSGYYQATVNDPTSEPIYGHYLCRGDQNTASCHYCVTTATTIDLPKTYCPNRKVAIIWYDQCMVRYSNDSFFSKMDQSIIHSLQNVNQIIDNATQFLAILDNMMNNEIAIQAAEGGPLKKFAAETANYSGFQTLYGLGQCTPDLTLSDCNLCLSSSSQQIISSNLGARILVTSCIVRYETYPFFNQSFLPLPPKLSPSQSPLPTNDTNTIIVPSGTNGKRKQFIRISLFTIIPMSIVMSALLYFGIRRFLHKRKSMEAYNNGGIDEVIAAESLRFDLNTIRSATSNFSADNKLGEGGFGQVYKGKLESGQEIAVKRLSTDSRQGINEFKTEVILVAKLQHKNLVKLLGFCVAATEKILIYEFLSNSSLDRFLFEPTKKACLDWQTRFNIVLGIARGLLYLHEDSRLKIIHRDLKSSNILLDEGMNPKISDFGLAKLFRVDETQGDTKRIVGTCGYMAPEYAITGHYSVKSDVYSFGVLLLEIVSGQRNSFFKSHLEEALLHRAWRLWTEDKALDLVDTTLCNNFPPEQLIQCIHIGLLCIQEDAFERPRMGPIVAALNGQSVSLSTPKAPHIFRSDTSAENGNALDNHCSSIYTGGEQMTELYPRD